MSEQLKAVKGMNDILPPESARWEWFEATVRRVMQRYAYQNVRTPLVEPTPLFVRGLGEVTDIVEKEMYSFEDKLNGDLLTLRPEGTAGVVRAVNEHSLLYEGPKRLFYIGAMFRHERPQKGRYRQFHQVGVEALGFPGPDLDVEVILMARALWRELGLSDVRLEINSLGQPAERLAHRAALIAYFEAHADQLDEDARRRLHSNPLRILDTKNPAMQALVEAAPKLIDHLGEASLAHLEGVKAALTAVGQPFTVNPRLVRGMDYYNLTVFEWVTDRLGSQGHVCAGGRYDGLIEQIGGKPCAGRRLGHGHRARAGAAGGQWPHRSDRGSGCLRRGAGRPPHCPKSSRTWSRCGRRASRCRCTPAARTGRAASSPSSRRPTPVVRDMR